MPLLFFVAPLAYWSAELHLTSPPFESVTESAKRFIASSAWGWTTKRQTNDSDEKSEIRERQLTRRDSTERRQPTLPMNSTSPEKHKTPNWKLVRHVSAPYLGLWGKVVRTVSWSMAADAASPDTKGPAVNAPAPQPAGPQFTPGPWTQDTGSFYSRDYGEVEACVTVHRMPFQAVVFEAWLAHDNSPVERFMGRGALMKAKSAADKKARAALSRLAKATKGTP